MRLGLTLFAVALAASAGAAVWLACRPQGATAQRPNVLVVAVDTLRADRLGCLGNTRGLTPNLDRLAASGVLFERAYSSAPWTLPSFASMFTSQAPEEHGAGGRVGDFRALDASHDTLAERFRDAGYATGAVVNVDFLGRAYGLMQGFESVDERFYADNTHLRDARGTTDAALAFLDRAGSTPFLLLAHYFDPHARYAPPAEYRARFADPRDQKGSAFDFGAREQVTLWRARRIQPTPDDFHRAELLYDAEVAFTDAEIGRLLDELSRRGLAQNTLVVLVADHGEEFLDHGDWEHGHTLYDELLHVPWILAQPGRLVPRRVPETVGTIDLAPTLAAWCGVPASPSFRGRDLAPALRGEALPPSALLAFGNFWGPPLESLRSDGWKWIEHRADAARPPELFHVVDDPRESVNRAATERSRAEQLERDLELLRRVLAGRAKLGPPVQPSAEERRRLQGMGYVGAEDDPDGK